jgi:hypothetical protein
VDPTLAVSDFQTLLASPNIKPYFYSVSRAFGTLGALAARTKPVDFNRLKEELHGLSTTRM